MELSDSVRSFETIECPFSIIYYFYFKNYCLNVLIFSRTCFFISSISNCYCMFLSSCCNSLTYFLSNYSYWWLCYWSFAIYFNSFSDSFSDSKSVRSMSFDSTIFLYSEAKIYNSWTSLRSGVPILLWLLNSSSFNLSFILISSSI